MRDLLELAVKEIAHQRLRADLAMSAIVQTRTLTPYMLNEHNIAVPRTPGHHDF